MRENGGKKDKKLSWLPPVLIFSAVLVVFNLVMNYLLIPYSFTRMKVHVLETQPFDNLILGSSHAATNIDAALLGKLTGKNSFNAAQGEQYTVDSYYLLRDACMDYKPKRVIYEFDPTYWLTRQETDSAYAGMFYEMRMSPVKVQYFFDKMWGADFRTWTAPWYFYRGRFADIPANLYTKGTENYRQYGVATFDGENQTVRGDGFIAVKPGKWEDDIIVREWNRDTIQKDDEQFFIKLAEYCRKQGIGLCVVTTPLPLGTYEAGKECFDAAYAHMDALSDRYGFAYLCYNRKPLLREDIMAEENFADWDGHMYEDAADRFTETLAEDLEKL
ncbi:MAG: hypothetical protein Q4A32_08165 [Lachnospiraceae bacterium]|nr:hypothetical protein [Lachnospiraceae bacterium]